MCLLEQRLHIVVHAALPPGEDAERGQRQTRCGNRQRRVPAVTADANPAATGTMIPRLAGY